MDTKIKFLCQQTQVKQKGKYSYIGDKLIRDINIVRNPVGKALTGALSLATGGEFGRNLENAPYDKLFQKKKKWQMENGSRQGAHGSG